MQIEISEIPKEWSAAFKNCHKKLALKEAETLKLLPHVLHACPVKMVSSLLVFS